MSEPVNVGMTPARIAEIRARVEACENAVPMTMDSKYSFAHLHRCSLADMRYLLDEVERLQQQAIDAENRYRETSAIVSRFCDGTSQVAGQLGLPNPSVATMVDVLAGIKGLQALVASAPDPAEGAPKLTPAQKKGLLAAKDFGDGRVFLVPSSKAAIAAGIQHLASSGVINALYRLELVDMASANGDVWALTDKGREARNALMEAQDAAPG